MKCEDDYSHPVQLHSFTLVHVNNGGERPIELKSSTEVKKEAYVLMIKLDILKESEEEPFSPDYECRLIDPIVNIQIVGINLSDEQNPVESDVSEHFKCFQIEETKDRYRIIPLPVDYIDIIKNSMLYMALRNMPESGKYQYKVVLTLESGETLTQTIDSIILL